MLRYIGKRALISLLSLFVLVTVSFFLTRQMPGSPFQTGNISGQVLSAIEEEYGLDRPVWEQYQMYLEGLFRGDLGISYKKPGVSVTEVIRRAWPQTAAIAVPAIILSLASGTLLGIWQASSSKKLVRSAILSVTMLGTGLPNFIIALLLALVFGVKLHLLPIAGLYSWQNYILPVLSLSIYPTSVITRIMQDSYQQEKKKDHVLLARAKGLSPARTALTHILKNAWIPVLNYAGPAAAFLITGSFAIESIFTIPGLGREFVTSITNRDYTLIMGLTIFMGATVIVFNFLTDLACAWLDPRIRNGYLAE